ncbi:MAG: leucine-rich repeat protein [Bacteroidota bacterium]|nr:leucine-rich repeat protein [Bacteroidota bacterium]
MKNLFFILSLFLLNTVAFGQVSKTVNITTAGTLNSLITSTEKTTITDLTVTGTIDASDIKFLRDEMTALTNLDLSASNIAAYTGTGGTYSTASLSYPANEIPKRAFFYKTGLKSIKLPSSTTSIGDYAFNYCSGINSVILPDPVQKIGDLSFASCTGLTAVTFPASLVTIGSSSFSNCSALTGNLVIPNSVTTIGSYAFTQCTGLNGTLTFPGSLTTIGTAAFSYCSGLKGNLLIPNSVTTIGERAFQNCSGFTGNLSISNSLTAINPFTFSNCTGLTGTLIIPTTVTTIGNNAFALCSGLTGSLTIPGSVSSIGNASFMYCNGLIGTLTIPNSVTSIGTSTFAYCSGFEELYLSKNLTSIPTETFAGCSGLKTIQAANPVPPNIIPSTFSLVDYLNCLLYVPIGSKSAYQTDPIWSLFSNISEKDFPSAIRNTNINGLKIYTNQNQIFIEDCDASVQLFTSTGAYIKTIYPQSGRIAIDLPKGLYILKIGEYTTKVVLY